MFKFNINEKIKIPSLESSGVIVKRKFEETDDITFVKITYDVRIQERVLMNVPEDMLKSKETNKFIQFDVFKEECPNRNEFNESSDTCLHYYKGLDMNDEPVDCVEINCPHYHFYKVSQKYHLTR